MRSRLVTAALYGGTVVVLGIWLYATYREEIKTALDRLSHCAGCRRRRDALTAVLRQAQEAIAGDA